MPQLAFGARFVRTGFVRAAEDGDVFSPRDTDSDAVESIVLPAAVHVEVATHLHRVAVRRGPAFHGFLRCQASVGEVVGGPAAEARLSRPMPTPFAVNNVTVVRRGAPSDTHQNRVDREWRETMFGSMGVHRLHETVFKPAKLYFAILRRLCGVRGLVNNRSENERRRNSR